MQYCRNISHSHVLVLKLICTLLFVFLVHFFLVFSLIVHVYHNKDLVVDYYIRVPIGVYIYHIYIAAHHFLDKLTTSC